MPVYVRIASIAGLLLATRSASAQQVTVQQPVVSSFSASTTVSVPDRGSAFLARIGRAADSRSSFGPFRSGTSVGLDREHAGMNVGAWIHDFEEMDRRLLEGGRGVGSGRSPALSGSAGAAWNRLHARHPSPARRDGALATHGGRGATDTPTESPAVSDRADRYYRLGLEAERRGAAGVARSHYLAATRYGSAGARERLERWEPTAIVER